MLKNLIIVFNLFVGIQTTLAQVGIGTSSPDSSSIIEVYSENKGVLFPRMTNSQRDAIHLPSHGLLIYSYTDNCLQINSGIDTSPLWDCVSHSFLNLVVNDCNTNGFEGVFVNGHTFTMSNKFTITITNRSLNDSPTLNFDVNDMEFSGISGVSVSSVSPTSAIIPKGGSQIVEYTLSGAPASLGTLTGTWSKWGKSCSNTVEIQVGDAMFTLPQTGIVGSINDVSVDIQGIVDNSSNQVLVNIPYTDGAGTYDAYTGIYIPNNVGTSEGSDANSFRITYPSGTFIDSGNITVTIEVDGDGSFNAKKQLFSIQQAIASLDFEVNGNSKGVVNLDVVGGIPDRNFADANHKFIYLPITAVDGNIWLNNNLGADYSNLNHAQYNPSQQATAYNDYHAYGSLFQYGRYSDGHELINYTDSTAGVAINGSTSINSTTDIPGHNLFILEGVSPFDWRDPLNQNLWQGGEPAINNPCPQGYRLPIIDEIEDLFIAESITNYTAAANSSLALSAAGFHHNVNNTIDNLGVTGSYLTSTISLFGLGEVVGEIGYLTSNSASVNNTTFRAVGNSIRCIKD